MLTGNLNSPILWLINSFRFADFTILGAFNNIEYNSSEPSILTIHNATLADQMNVQCNATNLHGYIFADIAVNVRGKSVLLL